jgi:putative DNA primase/helicase
MYRKEDFVEAFGIDVPSNGPTRNVRIATTQRGLCQGNRHNTLLSIAGLLRRLNYSLEDIQDVALAVNSTFDVPEDEHVVRTQMQDVVTRYDPSDDFIPSEGGLADQFIKKHGQDFVYCDGLGGWQIWDGKRWVRDAANKALMRVQETIRTLITQVKNAPFSEQRSKILNFLSRSETAARCKAILCLSQPYLAKSPDEFDRDRFLLNVGNGTLDLRTGTLREHRREDYITKITDIDYDPEAQCDLFEEFFAWILAGDPELIGFMKRALGYSLTGDISEQCWFVNYGIGSNGKTTLFNVVLNVFGEYGAQTPADTFLAPMSDRIRNDLARLRGRRLIVASEPDASRRLDSSMIKAFTGGDRITARYLYKEHFEYVPSGKLFLLCNHQPSVRANDHGFWRRVRMIPFQVVITEGEEDKHLESKLEGEAPGILRWLVEGCLEWQRSGLKPPRAVTRATRDYRDEMDVLGDFLTDPGLVIGKESVVPKADLYEHYAVRYCESKGLKPLSNVEFNRLMRAKGFEATQHNKERRKCWVGIGLVKPRP